MVAAQLPTLEISAFAAIRSVAAAKWLGSLGQKILRALACHPPDPGGKAVPADEVVELSWARPHLIQEGSKSRRCGWQITAVLSLSPT
jgi:hypothetical protein